MHVHPTNTKPSLRPSPLSSSSSPVWRHYLRWMAFVGSVVWNLSSPIKSWALSHFGFAPTEVSLSESLSWRTMIDHSIAKQLYAAAHVDFDLPAGLPIRFFNLYLDFMHHFKSTGWAHLVNEHHDDWVQGQFCRSTMRYRGDVAEAKLREFNDTGVEYWGEFIQQYVVEEANGCHVHEVGEAVLCLKGFNASIFLNLDDTTKLIPTDTVVHEMLVRYQQVLLPDLNDCLARRAWLLDQHQGKRKPALRALAQEIATNYSLNLRNVAGEPNLVTPQLMEQGFTDINGQISGRRRVEFAGGSDVMIEVQVEALAPIREVLYICSTLPVNMTLVECIDRWALVIPGIYMGWHATLLEYDPTLSSRYEKVDDEGVIQKFQLKRRRDLQNTSATYLPVTAISEDTATGTAYRDFVDRLLFTKLWGDAINWVQGDEVLKSRCFVRDNCFESCGATVNFGDVENFYFAYEDPVQGCVGRPLGYGIQTQAYVDEACYGIGSGHSAIQFTFTNFSNVFNMTHYTLNQTADPFEIMNCMMGGRVPSGQHLAIEVMDLVDQRPNLILLQSFSRGSEQTFLNFYTLLTLAGCSVFAIWILLVTWEIGRFAFRHPLPSIVHSLLRTSVAMVVWGRAHLLLWCFHFVSIVTWHIGASRTMCTWRLNGFDAWALETTQFLNANTQSPLYRCDPGSFTAPFQSWKEIIRVHAASYSMLLMVFHGPLLRGLTRTAHGFTLALVFLGLVPRS